MREIRHDNNLINRSGAVNAENETKLLWLIVQGAIYDENTHLNDVTDHTSLVYAENNTKLSWLIRQGVVYDENNIGQWCGWSYKCGLS